uniref:Defensin 2 n=1 Tax=Lens ervoides TaxID=41257 RepID=A0A343KJC4_LENER|nr:defensin 2 [Lens ervoides]
MEKKALSLLFMLFLLLASDVSVKRADALLGRCKVKSSRYTGACLTDTKCSTVCRGEGYKGGDCHGFRRRCMCLC